MLLALLTCLFVSTNASTQELTESSLWDDRLKHERLEDQKLYKYVWSWIYFRYHHPSFSPENWKQWEHKYDGKIYSSAEATTAINTMIASLNDRNVEMMGATIGSIGCELAPATNERWRVQIVGKDSPAARAGIHVGDIIESINNIPAMGTWSQIMSQLNGAPDTDVIVQANRNGSLCEFTLRATAEDSEPTSFLKKLNDGIFYIKPAFPFLKEEKRDHFMTAMGQLQQAGARGLIVDLRSNMTDGTYFGDLCGCFIGNKRAYGMLNRGSVKFIDGEPRVQIGNIPVIALINSTSNTSAEGLASCLKANKRAKLIGDTTSGHALVIKIENVDRYSRIRIPEWENVAADGSKLSGVGVKPDIVVPVKFDDVLRGPWWNCSVTGKQPDINDGHDVQLQRAIVEMKSLLGTK